MQFVGRLGSAAREKDRPRAIIWGVGCWMQDANNDEGRRTNDVRLFVHSSHSADRMSPSVPNLLGVQNRGWVVTLRTKKPVIIRRVNICYT